MAWMKCTFCGHVVSNLSNPLCAECGNPVDVHRMEYVPGSVLFGCPHCPRSYAPVSPLPGWDVCPDCKGKYHG